MAVTERPARISDVRLSRKGLIHALGIGFAASLAGASRTFAQAGPPSGKEEPKDKGQQASGTGHGSNEAKGQAQKQEGGGDKQGGEQKPEGDEKKKLSPEEKMARRFPQPVRVSYLVGLPMLDENNSTLGHIRSVVRNGEGKIKLVINYGGLFGIGERLIAVPVEVCGMLGRQVAALDMPRDEVEPAPTWYGSGDQPLDPGETIRVAIMRR